MVMMGDGAVELVVVVTSPFGPPSLLLSRRTGVLRPVRGAIHRRDQSEGMLCGQWHIPSGAGHDVQWSKLSVF